MKVFYSLERYPFLRFLDNQKENCLFCFLLWILDSCLCRLKIAVQTVFGATGKHAVGFVYAFGDEIVDQHT